MPSKTGSNINDIARIAGVSKTTVSFAFNNPSRVASKTLERILEIAKELHYSPNPIARTLTTKKIGSLGFLLPETTPEGFQNPFLFRLIQGLRIGCTTNHLSLNVVSPPEGHLIQTVQKTAVDGYVVLGMIHQPDFFELLEKRSIPMVSLDGGVHKRYPQVITTDKKGSYELMKHVLDQGHRNILILSFKDAEEVIDDFTDSVGVRRLRGYEKALQEQDMDLSSKTVKVIQCSECSVNGGYEAMEQTKQMSFTPDVVVAMSDIIAMGVYQYCQKNSINVPREISVAGFDDLFEVSLLSPAMSTVFQPAVEKGTIAAEMLIDLIDHNKEVENQCLKTELRIRESVMKI